MSIHVVCARISRISASRACARLACPRAMSAATCARARPKAHAARRGRCQPCVVLRFFPGTGWVDFDPKNNVQPAGEHITVACGRDFGDVSPVAGILTGGGRHSVKVAVDVEPV